MKTIMLIVVGMKGCADNWSWFDNHHVQKTVKRLRDEDLIGVLTIARVMFPLQPTAPRQLAAASNWNGVMSSCRELLVSYTRYIRSVYTNTLCYYFFVELTPVLVSLGSLYIHTKHIIRVVQCRREPASEGDLSRSRSVTWWCGAEWGSSGQLGVLTRAPTAAHPSHQYKQHSFAAEHGWVENNQDPKINERNYVTSSDAYKNFNNTVIDKYWLLELEG